MQTGGGAVLWARRRRRPGYAPIRLGGNVTENLRVGGSIPPLATNFQRVSELLPANAHNIMDTGARRSLRLHIQHQSTAEIGASISRPLLISSRVIKVWE